MFKTKTLGSLKSFFPPITQPLPLNASESQRLLNALTTSFRARLDEEHGFSDALPARPAVRYLPSAADPAPPLTAHKAAAHGRPTDQHLQSILNNPLFKQNETTIPAMQPNEVFERAVAKGLMTVTRARGFLLTVLTRINKSSEISVSSAMRDSGAGLLVVQWLRASGQERQLSFADDPAFMNILVQFMVAEGLEELALEWFRMLVERHRGVTDIKSSAPMVLRSLVLSKAKSTGHASGAYDIICKAEDYVKEDPLLLQCLVPAWLRTARGTTKNGVHTPNPASAMSFERFADLGNRLPQRHLYLKMDRAHLDLYHPTNPSPTRALAFLRGDPVWNGTVSASFKGWRLLKDKIQVTRGWDVQSGNGTVPASLYMPVFMGHLNLLAVDTADHLLQHGEAKRSEEMLAHIYRLLTSFKQALPDEIAWLTAVKGHRRPDNHIHNLLRVV